MTTQEQTPWWEEKETPNEFLNLQNLSDDEFTRLIGGAQPDKSESDSKGSGSDMRDTETSES